MVFALHRHFSRKHHLVVLSLGCNTTPATDVQGDIDAAIA